MVRSCLTSDAAIPRVQVAYGDSQSVSDVNTSKNTQPQIKEPTRRCSRFAHSLKITGFLSLVNAYSVIYLSI